MINAYDIVNGNPCCRSNNQCNCSAQIEQLKQCLCCISKQLSTLIANSGVDLTEVIEMLTNIQNSITDLSNSITTISDQIQAISTQQTEYYDNTMTAISDLSAQSTQQYNNIIKAIKKCCDDDDSEDNGNDSGNGGGSGVKKPK